jgi:hypothetical protein
MCSAVVEQSFTLRGICTPVLLSSTAQMCLPRRSNARSNEYLIVPYPPIRISLSLIKQIQHVAAFPSLYPSRGLTRWPLCVHRSVARLRRVPRIPNVCIPSDYARPIHQYFVSSMRPRFLLHGASERQYVLRLKCNISARPRANHNRYAPAVLFMRSSYLGLS